MLMLWYIPEDTTPLWWNLHRVVEENLQDLKAWKLIQGRITQVLENDHNK